MAVLLSSIYSRLKSTDGQQIRLVTGEKGLNNVVRWVHIVEVDELISFLEGNELIFVTGIAIKNEEDLNSLAEKIFENKASGLVINIGPYIKEIPESIIRFCSKRDFPLFEVPWQVYLGKTMKICAEEINRAEQRDMEISAAIQNAIFNYDNYNLYIPILDKYGFLQDFHYCVALITYISETDNDISEFVKNMCINIENSLTFYSVFAKAFSIGNNIVLLFANQTDSNIYEIAENIKQRYFVYNRNDIKVYMGIGRNTKSIRCIYKSYKIAHKVMELQKKKFKNNEIMSYRNMGFSKIFLAMDDTEIMKEYYSEVLEPLVQYDALNSTGFTDFLNIYFECGASVKETAERLYLHRNSVNYKISKIQDILGCDLSDVNVKTELLIALKLKEIL